VTTIRRPTTTRLLRLVNSLLNAASRCASIRT
jgi:hypothetical protein